MGVDNLARVAASWFDEFQAVFRHQGLNGLKGINVSETLQRRKALGCKPFAHFLHRFRKIYVDGAILPDKVFRIRNSATQECIHRFHEGYKLGSCTSATWFHLANRLPEELQQAVIADSQDDVEEPSTERVLCGGHYASKCSACTAGHDITWCHGDCTPVFGVCVKKQKLAAATKPVCCSGIREYKSLNCFDSLGDGGPLSYQCDVTGMNSNQQYLFTHDGLIHHSTGKCLMATKDNQMRPTKDCVERPELQWERIETFEADDMRLYREAVVKYNLSPSDPDH
eukprot:3729828-Amphidinium_carterae.1